MWFGGKPEDVVRIMKRLGITLEEISAVKVTIELEDGSMMVLEPPEAVLFVKSKDQPPLFMIVGKHRVVKSEKPMVMFTEEDVKFVAERAGVSLEEARKALKESGGDIAEAILRLTEGSS